MKTAELHFEPDGVIHLRGTSTPDSPSFNVVLSDTVTRLSKPEVVTSVRTINGGNTLEAEVRVGPPGWQAARKKKAEAEARAKAAAAAKPAKAKRMNVPKPKKAKKAKPKS